MNELVDDMKDLITTFNYSLKRHLPALEQGVNDVIASKCRKENEIENMLEIILSLTMHGVGDVLYIKLLDYYKTVNKEGADFYWQEYDKVDEE